jgi:hypothetical protein
MSRSGYTDDYDDQWGLIRWRGAVNSAIKGQRGQALLRDLLAALDAMPDKRLYQGNFATAEGEYCALGTLGVARGIRMDDLGDEDDCDTAQVAERFGIAKAMAAEIMYENDDGVSEWLYVDIEICGPMRQNYPDWGRHTKTITTENPRCSAQRWGRMRKWVESQIQPAKG